MYIFIFVQLFSLTDYALRILIFTQKSLQLKNNNHAVIQVIPTKIHNYIKRTSY